MTTPPALNMFNLGARVHTREFSWEELCIRAWGAEFRAPDHRIYQFQQGHNFDSTDLGATGIYNDLAGHDYSFIGTPSIYKNDWQGDQLQYTTPRTNICRQSQTLGVSPWIASHVTFSSDVAVAPDGTMTADKIAEDSAFNTHQTFNSASKAAAALPYTTSIFLKAAERNFVSVWMNDASGNGVYCVANLATGTLNKDATPLGAGWTGATASIKALANGWYRVSISAVTNAVASIELRANGNLDGTSASQNYQGVAGDGFYAWGAQIEAGMAVTSYIPTVAASASATDYALGTGTSMTFNTAPLAAAILSWTGTIYSPLVDEGNIIGNHTPFATGDGVTTNFVVIQ